jgi:superfamily II DNA or RNA helicase
LLASLLSTFLKGVDFPNVKIVCTVGLPATIVDALQRGGRAIRRTNNDALFVIFYESWVLDVNLDDYSTGDLLDPDRPRKDLHDNSQRRDRAPYSSVKLIQDKMCLRNFFADYLGDILPGGLLICVLSV